jgi:methyl-accepting chemotaxis protein
VKVLHKILVAPAVAIVFLLLLGFLSYGVLHRQNSALDELAGTRLGAYQLAAEAREDVAMVHSSVYRLITWLASLKEDQINAAMREQKAKMDAVEARLAAFAALAGTGEDERKLVGLASAELAKYRKSVFSAVDLSSGDTLTGATAMQLADKQFLTMVQNFDALVALEKTRVQQSHAAAGSAFRTAAGSLGAITLAAIVLACAVAIFMSRRIVTPLHTAISAARHIAQGDLTDDVRVKGSDETGQLLAALDEMTRSLRSLVGEVASGARTVAETSSQIAQGNLDLSQRTEEQASTLEETASSMEELTATVTQNADTARQANRLAIDASDVARKGGQVVGDVVSTMTGISASSKKIADIISVIDGIAFQTNILALNAAVEAARAGEQGRGFAVVAAEVRNLAQRSATAAKEIKALIHASVGQVEAGTKLVGSAGKTMEDIVQAVQKVSTMIAEIAAASEEQNAGISQVNTAITQMDGVVQQNASLVEEASAAAESMKDQAGSLLALVGRFRLQRGAAVAAPAAPAMQPIATRSAAPASLPPAHRPSLAAAPTAANGEWKTF